MTRNSLRATGAALMLSMAAAAQATTVPLDDEQSAAAAGLSMFHLGNQVPGNLAGLTYAAKDYTDRTLRLLEAAYRPSAVARARNGVVVACPVSGSFRAKYSTSSRVVEIEWNACNIEIYGQQHILTGPGKVSLCADDFTPEYVTSLSVGNGSRDLVERFVIDGVPTGPENQTVRNLRLTGYITFGRETVDDNFEGQFAYLLDGRIHTSSKTLVGVPGEVYQLSESGLTAKDVVVSGNLRYDDLGWEEDVRLGTGIIKNVVRYGALLDQPARDLSSSYRAVNLRVRNAGDYQTGDETLQVDGFAQYSFQKDNGPVCANGGYTYQTRVLLRHPPEFQSGVESYDMGEVLLNGAATLRFSANTVDPWDTGEMRVDMAVNGVGSFSYAGNSIYEALEPVAVCSN